MRRVPTGAAPAWSRGSPPVGGALGHRGNHRGHEAAKIRPCTCASSAVSWKRTAGVLAVAQRDHAPHGPTLARFLRSPPGRREPEGPGGAPWPWVPRKAPQALPTEPDVPRGRGKHAGCRNTCTVSGMARRLRDPVGRRPDNDMWDAGGSTAALHGKSPVPVSQSAKHASTGNSQACRARFLSPSVYNHIVGAPPAAASNCTTQ